MLWLALGNVSPPFKIAGTSVLDANSFIAISLPYSDRKERKAD